MNLLHNAQSFLLHPALPNRKPIFIRVEGPFRDFHFLSENAFFFYSFQSPLFRATKPCFIILCVQSVSWQHLTCSKCAPSVLRRFLLTLTLYSCLPFFFGLVSKTCFALSLSWHEAFTHFSHVLFFSHHFPKPSTVRLLHSELSPLPQFVSGFFHLLPSEIRCDISGIKIGSVGFLTFLYHHRRELQETDGFFCCTDCHNETSAFACSLIALGTKLNFFRFLLIRILCFSHVILRFFRILPELFFFASGS